MEEGNKKKTNEEVNGIKEVEENRKKRNKGKDKKRWKWKKGGR